MQATLSWVDDTQFIARTDSGHTVIVDGNRDTNIGASPMELVLVGLGGCSSYDVVHILGKSRQKVTGCVTQLTARRADAVPAVFTNIHIQFTVTGHNLDPKAVARAVALSAEKYCSASIMLQNGGVEVTHDYSIAESVD